MDFATIIVIALRLIVPFSILRYPLGGFAACLLLDASHAPLIDIIAGIDVFSGGALANYHLLDKWLDIYFLFFALLASLKWKNSLIKKTSVFLFALRFLGVILFSFSGFRYFLFFFPNLFELFYLYCAACRRWARRALPDSLPKLLAVLFVLAVPKLSQEYFYHIKQMGAGEVINLSSPTIWKWLKSLFLKPF